MAKSRRGPAPIPGVAVPIRTECCPAEGKQTVRFLGDLSGTFTHYAKKGSIPCLGEGECPANVHKSRMIWKGFAAAEYFRPAPYLDWCPCVWEITESGNEDLKGITLRGTVWDFLRLPGDCGKPEVRAILVATVVDLAALRPAFDCKPIVSRLYGYLPMQWGVASHVPSRLRLEPAKGELPPGVNADQVPNRIGIDTRSSEEKARIRELLEAGRAKVHGAANGNGNGNGKAVHS